MGGTLKPSLALPLNGVSGLRSTQRYQFQPETPLRTSAVRTFPRAAITLSGVLLRYGSIRLGWC